MGRRKKLRPLGLYGFSPQHRRLDYVPRVFVRDQRHKIPPDPPEQSPLGNVFEVSESGDFDECTTAIRLSLEHHVIVKSII